MGISIAVPLVQVLLVARLLLNQTEHHRKRYRDESADEDPRKDRCECFDHGCVAWMTESKGLEHTPDAVTEVCADEQHGDDVENGDWQNSKAADEIFPGVERNEVSMHGAGRQMKDVKDDK